MADPTTNPNEPFTRTPDRTHQRGEGGGAGSTTGSAAPGNPVALDVPTGSAPGTPDIGGAYSTGARMIPAGNAAGGVTPGGTSSKGTSGGAGLPGGTPPEDDNRQPGRLS